MAAYNLLSIRVLALKNYKSVQNLSMNILISVFINESLRGICMLATRHAVCGV